MSTRSVTPKPYDPTATQPLGEDAQQPMELPASTTTPNPAPKPQRQVELGPPQTTSKVAGIAYMANNILKGFAQGRQQAEMKKVATMKRTVDGQGFAYQATAQNLQGIVQKKLNEGMDPKKIMQDPEVQQATAARDAAWAGWMKSVGQMQQAQDGGGGKPKKPKKSKPMDEQNPVVGVMSQDPQEKAAAWYQVAAKAGPPDRFKIDDLIANGPRMSADRDTLNAEAAHAKDTATLQSRYDELRAKERAPIPAATHKINTGDVVEPPAAGGASTATPSPAGSPTATPKPAGTSGGGAADQSSSSSTQPPKSNLSDAEQRELKEATEELERRGTIKPGADGSAKGAPRMGRPVVAADVPEGAVGVDGQPFNIDPNNPHVGAVPIYYAGGVVRWQVYSVEQQGKTSAGPGGQPIISNYDKLHGTLDTQHPVGAGVQKGEVKVIKTRDAQGNEIEALTPVAPVYSTPHVNTGGGGKPYAGPERRGTAGAPHHDHAAAPPTTASDIPPGLPAGTKVFPAFQKATQDTYKAIRSQDLTLHGVPGTSDIGLKNSTLKALDSPDQRAKIALAMKALDTAAKQALSGHDETDFGYLQEFEKNFNNIPAVQGVMKDLNTDSKQYLADYFRAWTNAATLRSLQGSTGRPTQSMYAMLSNELPTIGVNVNSKEDAERYLTRLENDIGTAQSTLPDDMQKELTKHRGQVGSGGSGSGDHTKPHEVDSILDGIFGKPK